MNFDEYQKKAAETDLFPSPKNLSEMGFIEKILGLAGEVGEVTDKVKKILRDKEGVFADEDKIAIAKELGDVLWYITSVARCLGLTLNEVAEMNLAKLASRAKRNQLHGEGDER
ncbi:nucleoside triphosphate pyrophosphohydrolase family protein [Candidatus Saccharibacteria bacterium]|nr:nucleoside triphosphate pyrophosphohydrolase family protein [Candidatus Saccharibacteria bacterium]